MPKDGAFWTGKFSITDRGDENAFIHWETKLAEALVTVLKGDLEDVGLHIENATQAGGFHFLTFSGTSDNQAALASVEKVLSKHGITFNDDNNNQKFFLSDRNGQPVLSIDTGFLTKIPAALQDQVIASTADAIIAEETKRLKNLAGGDAITLTKKSRQAIEDGIQAMALSPPIRRPRAPCRE